METMRKIIKENKIGWPMSDNITPDQYYINQLLDKLDMKACEVESRWGVGRIERLVSFDMAQKWKRQMEKLNAAISESDVYTLPEIVNGTIRGYAAMESDAIAQGHQPMHESVGMSVQLPRGKELLIVRNRVDAENANRKDCVVWTLDEVANIIENKFTLINEIKAALPEAELKGFDFAKGDDLPVEFQ